MKLFVAGATGVIGWRTVARLVDAGHEVTGVARTDEKADTLRRLGATPVKVDLFDPLAVKEAVDGHEVVVNLATHIPPMAKAALPGAWHENDRIRTDASRHLVDAGLAAGATRYIQESITFLYEDAGAAWIDESAPRRVRPFARSVDTAEAEAARFTKSGGDGVVLRFGLFYGPDSHHTRDAVRMVEKRLPAAFGDAGSFISSISTDDAAAAVVAALAVPSGTYNVVDDEPVTRGEYGRILASALGVKPPRQRLSVMARAGGSKAEILTRSQRVSNLAFKDRTGWQPEDDSVRTGLPRVVAALRESG